MKLGEIKIESLRLMNLNDENLSVENLENYESDDRYKEYLEKIPGAINRAISRMMTYKVLSTKVEEIKPSQGNTFKQYIKFNLKEIISDFGNIERIMYIYERIVPNIEYQQIGEGTILIEFASSYTYKGEIEELPEKAIVGDAYNVGGICYAYNGEEWEEATEDETFNVEYTPNIKHITQFTPNDTELEIPEALARVVPYFVKAELYELDEPTLSATARNIFESALTEYVSFGMTRKQKQQYVKNTMW